MLINRIFKFIDTGIQASISALNSHATKLLNQKYASRDVLSMHSVAASTDLGFGGDYPLKVQTNYIDSFQGMALQHMFCNYFKYSSVTVFSSGDDLGRMSAIENQDETYCQITHLESVIIPADVDEVIARAKYSGSNIFVFFMSGDYTIHAAKIIAAGAKAGLFKEGTQIFGLEQITNALLFNTLESEGVDVKTVMKGYISLQNDANYNLMHTPAGLGFIERWRSQAATQWEAADSSAECSQARDGPDLTYLYRDGFSDLANHTCLGLDYSTFSADGSDLALFLGNTYDATYALAYGLHELIESGAAVTGTSLHDAVVDTVEFVGVSGPIDVFEGKHCTVAWRQCSLAMICF
jgi:hypothetical protein